MLWDMGAGGWRPGQASSCPGGRGGGAYFIPKVHLMTFNFHLLSIVLDGCRMKNLILTHRAPEWFAVLIRNLLSFSYFFPKVCLAQIAGFITYKYSSSFHFQKIFYRIQFCLIPCSCLYSICQHREMGLCFFSFLKLDSLPGVC